MVENSTPDNSTQKDAPIVSVLNYLSDCSQTIKLDSNRSIALNKPDSVYLVNSGCLDIFAIPNPDADVVGPRINIMRVESGQLLFGFSKEKLVEQDMAFIGVSSSKTELLEMSLEGFLDKAISSQDKTPFVMMIETLVKGALDNLIPKLGSLPVTFREMTAGLAQESRDHTVLSVRQGLFWVHHTGGVFSFIDRPELSDLLKDRMAPVSRSSWIEISENCSVSAETTGDLFRDVGTLKTALIDFHDLVIHLVGIEYQQRKTDQATMLVQERDQEDRLVESALEALSSTIIKDRREFVALKGKPLLDACRIVGAQSGITFVPIPHDEKGSGDPLKDICEASRVRSREVLLTGKWWKEDHGSFLGFMDEDARPVAILSKKTGVYTLCNPVDGTKIRVNEEVAERIRPVAHVFQTPFPEKALNAWDLVKFSLKGLGPDIWRNIGFGVMTGLLSLITPIATGILIDDIIPSEDRSQLIGLSLAFVVSAICISLFQFAQALSVLRIEGKAGFVVQSAVWDRLLSLPVTFFRKYPAGDLANRTLGIDQMRQLISTQAMTTVLTSVFSIFQIGLLFYYSIELAFVALVLTAISLIVPVICFILQLKYQRPLYDLLGKIQAFNLQVINGIAKLRISAAEKRMYHLWASMFSRQKELSYKAGIAGNVLGVSVSSLSLIGTFVMFAWIFFSTDKALHAISPGQFMAFISAFTGVLGSAYSTLTTVFPMMQVKPVYERTKPILSALPEVKQKAVYPGELSGRIELSKVSFRYNPDGPLIIKNFSLEILPREFVALVGPSGSGKSTLIRLLLGFDQPESGAILYDGQDLAKLDVKAVRRQIGVVLQNGLLFSGSIFENIVGSSPLTLDDAWEAARMAQLEDDIKEMPMGMNTVIGEGGDGLSGGQRQRLLIARAIVRRPRILFFDEATSALDNERQELVSKSIEELEASRLVLAHRLSTIRNAHKICVIVEGEVVEMGNFDELMAKGGVFSELAKRQIV